MNEVNEERGSAERGGSSITDLSTDLNLFVVLDAIYAEGGVTRASRRLNLSQPAVSHALNRLRRLFDDPLFERRGHSMVATPLTHRLIPTVHEALDLLQSAVEGESRFDPASSTKRFAIGMRGDLEPALVPRLATVVSATAPGVTLQFVRAPRAELERELTSGTLDAAIDVPLPLDTTIHRQLVHAAPLVVAVRAGHPRLGAGPGGGAGLDLDAYLAEGHIQVSGRRRGMSAEDFALSRLGAHRTIRIRSQSYPAAWRTMAATDLLLTLAQPYASLLHHGDGDGDGAGVRVLDCPVDVPRLEWHLYWHANRDHDPANAWLRRLVTDPATWWPGAWAGAEAEQGRSRDES